MKVGPRLSGPAKEAVVKNERKKEGGDGVGFSSGSVGPSWSRKKSLEAFKGHRSLASPFASCQSTLWIVSYFATFTQTHKTPWKSARQIISGLWGKNELKIRRLTLTFSRMPEKSL